MPAYAGDPSADTLSAVRFWLQDTGVTPLLTDNELRYLISYTADYSDGDPLLIAAAACSALMAKYAGRAAISADGVTINAGELQNKYATLAASLREQYRVLNAGKGVPLAGGLPDAPLFALGLHDNPEGPSQLLERNHEWLEDPANYQT